MRGHRQRAGNLVLIECGTSAAKARLPYWSWRRGFKPHPFEASFQWVSGSLARPELSWDGLVTCDTGIGCYWVDLTPLKADGNVRLSREGGAQRLN